MLDGRAVRAGHVVLATNSPINRNLAIHSRQMAMRTYCVGLKIPRSGFRRAEYWSTETPAYTYVRAADLDAEHYVLIVGGGDHHHGANPDESPYVALERHARERWAAAGELLFRWAGEFFQPPDLLGFYGFDPLKLDTRTLVITGDSGQVRARMFHYFSRFGSPLRPRFSLGRADPRRASRAARSARWSSPT